MTYVDLILNLALLVALSIVSGFIDRHPLRHRHLGVLLQGVVFGGAAVFGMLRPLNLGNGIIFDGRSVMISLCALYFGPGAVAIAAALAAACRISLGGGGLTMGLLVILSSAAIGLLARRRLQPETTPPSTRTLYGFGLLVHLAMVVLMLALPSGSVLVAMAKVGIPVLLLYPLATILAGHILSDQVESGRRMEALRGANAYLENLIGNANSPIVVWDDQLRITSFNHAAEVLTGRSAAQALGATVDSFFLPDQVEESMWFVRQTLEGKQWEAVELEIHHVNGSVRTVLWNSATIFGPDGTTPVAVIAQGQDITERKLAEKELAESHALLANLARLVPGVIYQYRLYPDGHSAFPYASPGMNDIYEVTPEEVREDATPVFGRLHPDDYDRVSAAIFASARTLETFHCEFRVILPRQGLRWRWSQAHPERTADGGTLWHGIISDITERKQAEEGLRESEARLHAITDSAQDAIIMMDPQGLITYWNPAAERILGYTRAEAIGHDPHALIALPTHRAAHATAFPAFQRTGTGNAIGRTLDLPARRKDGTQIHIQLSLSAIQMADGWHAVGLLRDATESKQAEERLRDSEERFRLLVKNSSDIIVIVEADGTQRYVSPAAERITGFPAEHLAGRLITEVIHPDDLAHVRQAWSEIIQVAGSIRNVVYRHAHRTAGWVWLEALAQNCLEDPAVRGVVVSVRDITERRRAEGEKMELEAQLQQAQKMESVGRLAGGVAHDFNNMLQAILGYTEMALEQLPRTDPLRADIEEIHRVGLRAAELTRQLLAFARRQTIAPQELDLNQAVSGMLNMLERLIGENIDLAWRPGQDLWTVKLDPTQIDQILTNLCVNARDAIAGIGRITIETANRTFGEADGAAHPDVLPGEYVQLVVTDDGCGMDDETLSHLFEPFFTTKGAGRGTGLGLATVYGAVKQNDGFVSVYSKVGEGTSLRIYLPRHVPEAKELWLPEPDAPMAHGQETILLAEDDPAILTVARLMLERQGYTVLATSDPREAVSLALEYGDRIDLLLTDVIMPGMSGRDLANQLLGSQPHLNCLFMSGYTADIIARHGVLDEGLHFLQKPFSAQSLAAAVRKALDAER